MFVERTFDPTLYAAPLFLLAIGIEYKVLQKQRQSERSVRGYERRDAVASVAMGLVSLLPVGLLLHMQFVLAQWLWPHRVTDLGEGVLGWIVAMIGWDFMYYWLHRFEHESRVLWAAHVNHHSSEYYNLATALRQPWTPWLTLLMFPPLALVGVRPGLIIAAGGFNLIYQFWIHTEAIDRMPRWFEWVFNTPSHHRVHHGANEKYLDSNYAGILIVWDKLFGSFVPEQEPVRYGLTTNIETYNLWTIAFHEYVAIARDVRQASSWRVRFKRVFAGPGYKPELSD
ncbi:MAG: sterol desaturase family protein [Deltaproteobacteria bacterium]|nr:sterol desaturase family protein [Deltaproteobacteria bacterium]